MRYSVKTMLVATAIVAMATWAVIWFLSPPVYTATLLNKTSLRTDAPQSALSLAVGDVYEELRLRHFMDSNGLVTFSDGTSSDTTSNEMVSVTGGVATGKKYFDDPDGNRITLTWTTEPRIGTLLTWEYQGKDPQDVSVAVQKALAKQGVKLLGSVGR